ncbi:rCG21722, partial [Rattus norvegicus]
MSVNKGVCLAFSCARFRGCRRLYLFCFLIHVTKGKNELKAKTLL